MNATLRQLRAIMWKQYRESRLVGIILLVLWIAFFTIFFLFGANDREIHRAYFPIMFASSLMPALYFFTSFFFIPLLSRESEKKTLLFLKTKPMHSELFTIGSFSIAFLFTFLLSSFAYMTIFFIPKINVLIYFWYSTQYIYFFISGLLSSILYIVLFGSFYFLVSACSRTRIYTIGLVLIILTIAYNYQVLFINTPDDIFYSWIQILQYSHIPFLLVSSIILLIFTFGLVRFRFTFNRKLLVFYGLGIVLGFIALQGISYIVLTNKNIELAESVIISEQMIPNYLKTKSDSSNHTGNHDLRWSDYHLTVTVPSDTGSKINVSDTLFTLYKVSKDGEETIVIQDSLQLFIPQHFVDNLKEYNIHTIEEIYFKKSNYIGFIPANNKIIVILHFDTISERLIYSLDLHSPHEPIPISIFEYTLITGNDSFAYTIDTDTPGVFTHKESNEIQRYRDELKNKYPMQENNLNQSSIPWAFTIATYQTSTFGVDFHRGLITDNGYTSMEINYHEDKESGIQYYIHIPISIDISVSNTIHASIGMDYNGNNSLVRTIYSSAAQIVDDKTFLYAEDAFHSTQLYFISYQNRGFPVMSHIYKQPFWQRWKNWYLLYFSWYYNYHNEYDFDNNYYAILRNNCIYAYEFNSSYQIIKRHRIFVEYPKKAKYIDLKDGQLIIYSKPEGRYENFININQENMSDEEIYVKDIYNLL